MAEPFSLRILPIGEIDKSLFSAFDCGEKEINLWFSNFARQSELRHETRTFALLAESGALVGFYALTGALLSNIQTASMRGIESYRYQSPVTLLVKMGIEVEFQEHGFGRLLLYDALRKTLDASKLVATGGLIVQPKTIDLRSFYQKSGFRQISVEPDIWGIALAEIHRALAK